MYIPAHAMSPQILSNVTVETNATRKIVFKLQYAMLSCSDDEFHYSGIGGDIHHRISSTQTTNVSWIPTIIFICFWSQLYRTKREAQVMC